MTWYGIQLVDQVQYLLYIICITLIVIYNTITLTDGSIFRDGFNKDHATQSFCIPTTCHFAQALWKRKINMHQTLNIWTLTNLIRNELT